MAVFTERNYGEKLDEHVKDTPHVTDLAEKIAAMLEINKANIARVTVFELMKTIYNFMSDCYTTGELWEKTRAIKVLADSICVELTDDLEGLEP